jgi:hypothetical protein
MQGLTMEEANINTLLRDTWSEGEAAIFWTGYEDFLDRLSTVSDDERTIAMDVYS